MLYKMVLCLTGYLHVLGIIINIIVLLIEIGKANRVGRVWVLMMVL
jgi:hypothetical protein